MTAHIVDLFLSKKTVLNQYEKYLDIFEMDIHAFRSDYELKNRSLEEMEKDIKTFIEKSENIQREIPHNVSLGIFLISCENVRNLVKKDLSKTVLDIIGSRAVKMAVSVSNSMTAIQKTLTSNNQIKLQLEEVSLLNPYMN